MTIGNPEILPSHGVTPSHTVTEVKSCFQGLTFRHKLYKNETTIKTKHARCRTRSGLAQ